MTSPFKRTNDSDLLDSIIKEAGEEFKLTSGTFGGSATATKIKDNFPKRIFVCIFYLHQYAEGITGANRAELVLVGKDGNGFRTKGEARSYFSSVRSKFKSKETQKDQGYGALGTFYNKPEFLTGTQLASNLKGSAWQYFSIRFVTKLN